MAQFILYLERQETANLCRYDDDENPVYYSESKTTLERIETDTLNGVFEKYEDGDGDDGGSWGVMVTYITNQTGKVLYSFNAIKDKSREDFERIKADLIEFYKYNTATTEADLKAYYEALDGDELSKAFRITQHNTDEYKAILNELKRRKDEGAL